MLQLFVRILCFVIAFNAVLGFLSGFAIILMGERADCFTVIVFLVTVNALWLFLTVPWAGLQCVIAVFTFLQRYVDIFLCISFNMSQLVNEVLKTLVTCTFTIPYQ